MSITTSRKLCLLLLFLFAHRSFAIAQVDASPRSELKKWDLFADFLYWNLEETCTQWAFVIDPTFASPPAAPFTGSYPVELDAVDFDWNSGVRAGISYTLPHDFWDTRVYYTWYHTSGANRLAPSDGRVIQSQFIATDFLLSLPLFPLAFHEAKIKWNVLYNMFNWDVGRVCSLGNYLSLRPYLGIQGGWIRQKIDAYWIASNTLIPYNARQYLEHGFWGIGPEAGVNSQWKLVSRGHHVLSIWGDFSQVFLWGNWSFTEKSATTIGVDAINTQPDRQMGALAFLGGAGVVWDCKAHNNSTMLTVKLGYELQVWMQHLQFFQHFSGILNNALTLQGATCRLQLNF